MSIFTGKDMSTARVVVVAALLLLGTSAVLATSEEKVAPSSSASFGENPVTRAEWKLNPHYKKFLRVFNGSAVPKIEPKRDPQEDDATANCSDGSFGGLNEKHTSIVTHVTLDRRERLVMWCKLWRGPISASVFERPSDRSLRPSPSSSALVEDAVSTTFKPLIEAMVAKDPCLQKYLTMHLVVHLVGEADGSPESDLQQKDPERFRNMYAFYPFNVQRNAALDGAVTKRVFLLDSDFWLFPKVGAAAYERRMNEIVTWVSNYSSPVLERSVATKDDENSESRGDKHTPEELYNLLGKEVYEQKRYVMVVPATETVSKEVDPPETLEALRNDMSHHIVTSFYGHHCRDCHNPTNLGRYSRSDLQRRTPATTSADDDENKKKPKQQQVASPYLVAYTDGYEPYVVALDKTLLPRYDERFVGRGYSKMSFFYELDGMGFQFVVLPAENLKAPPPPPASGDEASSNPSKKKQKESKTLVWPYLVHIGGRGDVPSPQFFDDDYKRRQRTNRHMSDNFKLDVDTYVKGIVDPAVAAVESGADLTSASATGTGKRTSRIDWRVISTATLGKDTTCVSRIRDSTEAALAGIIPVLHSTCLLEGINCAPIFDQFGLRNHGDWVHRADWIFDRAFQEYVKAGWRPETACNFSGFGTLTRCPKRFKCCAPRQGVAVSRLLEIVDFLCSPSQVGPCNQTVETFINSTRALRDYAAVAMTWHYMMNRCSNEHSESTCDFGGAAGLVDCMSEMLMPDDDPDREKYMLENTGVKYRPDGTVEYPTGAATGTAISEVEWLKRGTPSSSEEESSPPASAAASDEKQREKQNEGQEGDL